MSIGDQYLLYYVRVLFEMDGTCGSYHGTDIEEPTKVMTRVPFLLSTLRRRSQVGDKEEGDIVPTIQRM